MKILKNNVDITELSNFKTPAKTKYFYEFNGNLQEFCDILKFQKENNLQILFVAWGTNLLFAFDLFDGIVVKNSMNKRDYDVQTKTLQADSNAGVWEISEILEKKYKQDIWHRFIWLPWSIAWAIFGNAWCFGLEIENNLIEVEALNLETWQTEILSKKECEFSYRNSVFKKTWKYFILKARFDLSKKVEKYHSDVDNIYFREHKQPKWNTCWSTFKNPSSENAAWKLIENVWLKWYNLNWAFFSPLHANFLMSDGRAQHSDLLELIELAKNKVKEKFDLNLELEIRIVKNI